MSRSCVPLRRLVFGSLAAAASALVLAGCAVGPAPSSSPTSSSAANPSASASASATPSVDPSAPAGQCADTALKISISPDPAGGSAGHLHYDVVFTNTGSSSCALEGYPGVSVAAASGQQVGPAAAFAGSAPVLRTMAPGASVFAPLSVEDIGTTGGVQQGCSVELGSGWAVYAPHSYARVIVPSSDPVPACAHGPSFMTVTAPVAPGTH